MARKYRFNNKLAQALIWLTAVSAISAVALPAVAENSLDNSAYERVFWKQRPIRMHFMTGVERLLRFPAPVQIGLPPELAGMVQVESVENVVYLTPLADFDVTRLRFRELDSGTIYLVDAQASPMGSDSLVELVNAQTSNDLPSTIAEGGVERHQAREKSQGYGYGELNRYAFQQVYAPERLVKPLSGVSKLSIRSKKPIAHLVAGENIAATPLAQWRTTDGLYVIAVYLNNLSHRTVELDPRRFRHSDDWLSTGLITGHLTPHDTLGDASTLVVISKSSWGDSVQWLR